MQTSLLDSLHLPDDIKRLSDTEARRLAQEVRNEIIKVVSSNGGHLAPCLGVVELTVALLAVMDVPKDKIIWDVGHQCYAYKLLTDRRDSFHTLRRAGGISGFPRPAESPYDAFVTGHASTSISAALGLARARDLADEPHKVVAVIGDGALGGGMAWEAINSAGDSEADLLVILNDNNMSISPSIGALATHMARLRSLPLYRRVRNRAQRLVRDLPVAGVLASRAGKLLKQGATALVSPQSGAVFEALGFEYLGPVNGHDFGDLRYFIEQAREMKGPVLLHAVTTKGKGYYPAEQNARHFHGVGPFDCTNGKCSENAPSAYTDVFGDALVEIARRDPRVVAITAAMPDGTGLSQFAEQYPDRFFDVGIAEQHAVTFAAGLARGGAKPVVAVYSTFLQRAYDQIVHDVCLQKLPVVFAIDRAGIVGEDGPTHHGVFDLSYLRHIPNLTLMSPRDATELANMLWTALRLGSPVAIRYPRGVAKGTPEGPLGAVPMCAEVLREGRDVAIIAVGPVVNCALEAAAELEEMGIYARVVDARFVKPMDEEAMTQAALECGALVLVEDNVGQGGFSGAVLECLANNGVMPKAVQIVALPDGFISHGKSADLREAHGLCGSGILDAALDAVTTLRTHNMPRGERIVIRQHI